MEQELEEVLLVLIPNLIPVVEKAEVVKVRGLDNQAAPAFLPESKNLLLQVDYSLMLPILTRILVMSMWTRAVTRVMHLHQRLQRLHALENLK